MRINSSQILSLLALKSVKTTQKAIARSIERLASGSDTRSSADVARYQNLNVQLRGTRQAILNINQGYSLLTTADHGLDAQQQIVGRMLELALRGSNSTLSSADRSALQSEFDQLMSEFQRISQETTFGDHKLLAGQGLSLTLQAGSRAGDTIKLTTPGTDAEDIFENLEFEYLGTYQSVLNTSASLSNLGTYPLGKATGDVDGDGDLDYVYNDRDTATNFILLNNGQGVFSVGSTFSGINISTFMDHKIEDVNGDGFNDIISVASNAASNFQVRLNDGAGGFSSVWSTTVSAGVSGRRTVQMGDVDNDGDLDAVINRQFDGIDIYLNDGAGVFTQHTTFATGGDSRAMRLGDFDGDGNIDIASKLTDVNGIAIYYGNGTGAFTFSSTFSIGLLESFAVGDLNQDGRDDIIVENGNLQVSLGRADRTWSSSAAGSITGINSNSIELFDYNSDGILDIGVTTASNSALEVKLGIGDGTFTGSTLFLGAGVQSNLSAGDFNGDGQVDFITQNVAIDTLSIHRSANQLGNNWTEWSLDSESSAQDLLEKLESVRTNLDAYRASIGAQMSRLESAVNYLSNLDTNLAEAEDRQFTVDYALEIAELTRLRIIEQASIAVMAQANLQMKLIEELLK